MQYELNANIWKYALLLIANKRIFVAILGAYYLTIPGVTPEGIGIILLSGSLAGFLLEIPSGYISDRIGHKRAIVFSRILMIVSTLFFLFAHSIELLILGAICLSAGHAFLSGTGNAFMHETLKGLGREKDYAEVMGKISAIGFAVPIILMVLVPFLVDISFRAPFVIGLFVDLVGLIAALLLAVPRVPQKEIDEIRLTNFRSVMKEGYRLNFFAFALFAGLTSGMFMGISGFRPAYQMFLEIPVIWFGVLFGIGRLLASLILVYSGVLKRNLSLFLLYGIQIALYTCLFVVLGTVAIPWVVVTVFIIMNALNWGLSRVNNSYLVDIIRTSKHKATLLSTESQINSLVAAAAAFGLGFTIERLSYQLGFLYLGIAFFVTLFPLYLYIVKKHKKLNEELSALNQTERANT